MNRLALLLALFAVSGTARAEPTGCAPAALSEAFTVGRFEEVIRAVDGCGAKPPPLVLAWAARAAAAEAACTGLFERTSWAEALIRKGRAFAARALEADPTMAMALQERAHLEGRFAQYFDTNALSRWRNAEDKIAPALEKLAPQYPDAMIGLGLMDLGWGLSLLGSEARRQEGVGKIRNGLERAEAAGGAGVGSLFSLADGLEGLMREFSGFDPRTYGLDVEALYRRITALEPRDAYEACLAAEASRRLGARSSSRG